jgi:hypothetical protein
MRGSTPCSSRVTTIFEGGSTKRKTASSFTAALPTGTSISWTLRP